MNRNISNIIEALNEGKSETFDVVRLVDVGDYSSDKMPLGTVSGSLSDMKKAAKKFGKVKEVDVKKKEIIVEVADLTTCFYVYSKGQQKKAKLFNDYYDAEMFAKKMLSSLKSAKSVIPESEREVYITQGGKIIKTYKVNGSIDEGKVVIPFMAAAGSVNDKDISNIVDTLAEYEKNHRHLPSPVDKVSLDIRGNKSFAYYVNKTIKGKTTQCIRVESIISNGDKSYLKTYTIKPTNPGVKVEADADTYKGSSPEEIEQFIMS